MRKEIARFLGTKLPYFKGKNKQFVICILQTNLKMYMKVKNLLLIILIPNIKELLATILIGVFISTQVSRKH